MTAARRGRQLRPVEPLPWTVHDWTTTPAERREASAREICLREASRPFQLDSDLMVRASLHNLGGDRWWLLVLMHHSAIDGWSTQAAARGIADAARRRGAARRCRRATPISRAGRRRRSPETVVAALKNTGSAQLEGCRPYWNCRSSFRARRCNRIAAARCRRCCRAP